mgnify:CR=1 FL=1
MEVPSTVMNLAEIEKTINDFLYAYDGKNYYQVYSFKDNVNASLSEALSVNALNDISDLCCFCGEQ